MAHAKQFPYKRCVMIKYRAILFDLDGTLADTLDAIAHAANDALRQLGRPTHPTAAYRTLAGQGLQWLVEHALGDEHVHLASRMAQLHAASYNAHAHETTRPYAGIPEMMDALEQRHMTLAILSNKPHEAVGPCVEHILPDTTFAVAEGVKPGGPLKPDPTGALRIAANLAISPDRWLYVGDTRVDMHTGRAAGMFTVGVTWGFRDEAELLDSGAQAIIHQPAELLDLINASPTMRESSVKRD